MLHHGFSPGRRLDGDAIFGGSGCQLSKLRHSTEAAASNSANILSRLQLGAHRMTFCLIDIVSKLFERITQEVIIVLLTPVHTSTTRPHAVAAFAPAGR